MGGDERRNAEREGEVREGEVREGEVREGGRENRRKELKDGRMD